MTRGTSLSGLELMNSRPSVSPLGRRASALVAAACLSTAIQASPPTPADVDLDGNGFVDGADIGLLLLQWGGPGTADFDENGVVSGADLGQLLLHWAALIPPTITHADPASVLVVGGDSITIHGRSLASTHSVTFGGVEAMEIIAADADSVTVRLPAHPYGSADVVVSTLGGATTALGLVFFDLLPIDWGTVLEPLPDPAVVTTSALREAIIATNYPWRVRHNASQIEMLLVPPGSFTMGCDSSQYGCWHAERPPHVVSITQPFYLGRYEVTQSQWQAAMGSNPCYYCGSSKPINNVSWQLIQSFEAVTGLRLPTEAEWEHACRGGTTGAYSGTLHSIAWFNETANGAVMNVGLKSANPLGFHDMHGNVAEWVNDRFSATYYQSSPAFDPPGPAAGVDRVIRGGWSGSYPSAVRSASRNHYPPALSGTAVEKYGFRAARSP